MKVFFLESETRISHAAVIDSLKQAVQEKMPEFQNDAVFSLAYEREDQFFLKSPETILWGKVYFDTPLHGDLENLKAELKKISGIFRRKVIPYVFLTNESSACAWLNEFGKIAESCFIYGFAQSEGRRALTLRRISQERDPVIPAEAERENRGARQGRESSVKPFQLSREELSELIDLSLELRCLN
jgi:hypothetical protein